jgi:hypothetical protein
MGGGAGYAQDVTTPLTAMSSRETIGSVSAADEASGTRPAA